MDPATVFAEWKLERIPGEKLSLVASALLAEGFDVPSLKQLASSPPSEANGDRSELLIAAMDELGLEHPSCEQAALLVAANVARQLFAGELSTRDVCADITTIGIACHDRPDALLRFYPLLEEWELVAGIDSSSLEKIDSEIRSAAKRLLELEQAQARGSRQKSS